MSTKNGGVLAKNQRVIKKIIDQIRNITDTGEIICNDDWNRLVIEVSQVPTERRTTWDEHFMTTARFYAKRSRHPNHRARNGAVIASQDHIPLSSGYNSPPRDVDDRNPEMFTETMRNAYFLHAEENAILCAAREGISLRGSIIYTTWSPCHRCARLIIQAGIIEIVVGNSDFGITKGWQGRMGIALRMFEEANISLRRCNAEHDEGHIMRDMLQQMENQFGPPTDIGKD